LPFLKGIKPQKHSSRLSISQWKLQMFRKPTNIVTTQKSRHFCLAKKRKMKFYNSKLVLSLSLFLSFSLSLSLSLFYSLM
jgi:hypothetical protein